MIDSRAASPSPEEPMAISCHAATDKHVSPNEQAVSMRQPSKPDAMSQSKRQPKAISAKSSASTAVRATTVRFHRRLVASRVQADQPRNAARTIREHFSRRLCHCSALTRRSLSSGRQHIVDPEAPEPHYDGNNCFAYCMWLVAFVPTQEPHH